METEIHSLFKKMQWVECRAAEAQWFSHSTFLLLWKQAETDEVGKVEEDVSKCNEYDTVLTKRALSLQCESSAKQRMVGVGLFT